LLSEARSVRAGNLSYLNSPPHAVLSGLRDVFAGDALSPPTCGSGRCWRLVPPQGSWWHRHGPLPLCSRIAPRRRGPGRIDLRSAPTPPGPKEASVLRQQAKHF